MKNDDNEGAWIFLSHSHKDIEKVRFIRNEFEKLGHNPLMFFLKCLNDESELDDLIKREIIERNWFILCDSSSAKASKWVQEEVEMIKNLEGKVFKTISLEEDVKKQIENITQFSRRTGVFISSSIDDIKIVEKISHRLKEQEYNVFSKNDINDVSRYGYFLILLNEDTHNNKYVIEELTLATENNANIIPVFLKPYTELMNQLPLEVSSFQGLDFSNEKFDMNMNMLITCLKKSEVRNQHISNILNKLDNESNNDIEYYIAPGSGKSHIILNLILAMKTELKNFNNVKSLLLTDRKMLSMQYVDTFKKEKSLQVSVPTSAMDLSKSFQDDSQVIVATIQSIVYRDIFTENKMVIFIDVNMNTNNEYILNIKRLFPYSKIITFTREAAFNSDMETINALNDDILKEYRKSVSVIYEKFAPKFRLKHKEHEYINIKSNIIENSKFIIKHYAEKIRPNGFKAIIVCSNQLEAIEYQKTFLELRKQGLNPFNSKVIIFENDSSFVVSKHEEDNVLSMFKSDFSDSNSNQYNNIAFLIVVTRLLIGYDAPIIQGYYLNKALDINTLDIIENKLSRPYKEKKFGYIIDYMGLNESHFVNKAPILTKGSISEK